MPLPAAPLLGSMGAARSCRRATSADGKCLWAAIPVLPGLLLEGAFSLVCRAAAAHAAPLSPSTSHDMILDKPSLTMAFGILLAGTFN